jgi:hypothetical protein
MIKVYQKSKFNKEELMWAVMLCEAEFEKEYRNTPEKLAKLISENFDVICKIDDVRILFNN